MKISKITSITFRSNSQNDTVKEEKDDNSSYKKSAEKKLDDATVAILNKAQILSNNLSFCGMKKSQFDGIDLIMVNKLTKENGFNIQSKTINSNDDFQQYCQNILDKKYYGEDNSKKLSKSNDSQAELQK